MPPDQTPEFGHMLEQLPKCLELRDRYPRDHDSAFHGIAEGISDVMGVRPEVTGSYEPIKE